MAEAMIASWRKPVLWTALLLRSITAEGAETPPPAYQIAAYQVGVPSEVLYSVALQESGAQLRGQLVPWPWTLNVAGAGYRFATRSDACKALVIAIAEVGPKRVDSGLGQVNIGWNGHRFGSRDPCESLNPYKNLAVTAQILAEQRALGGDWITVAGRYHRPAGGAPAANYRKAFARHLSRVTGINLMVGNP